MVSSAAKRAKRKRLTYERQERELSRPARQMDPVDLSDPETGTGRRRSQICSPRTECGADVGRRQRGLRLSQTVT